MATATIPVSDYVGTRKDNGAVNAYPKRYVNGVEFNQYADQAATKLSLGGGYFCVLPMGYNAIPEELDASVRGYVAGLRAPAPVISGPSLIIEEHATEEPRPSRGGRS